MLVSLFVSIHEVQVGTGDHPVNSQVIVSTCITSIQPPEQCRKAHMQGLGVTVSHQAMYDLQQFHASLSHAIQEQCICQPS